MNRLILFLQLCQRIIYQYQRKTNLQICIYKKTMFLSNSHIMKKIKAVFSLLLPSPFITFASSRKGERHSNPITADPFF